MKIQLQENSRPKDKHAIIPVIQSSFSTFGGSTEGTTLPGMHTVSVTPACKTFRALALKVCRFAEEALPHLSRRPVAADIFLVGDAEMCRLNRDFRGSDRETNVLSFETSSGAYRPDLSPAQRFIGEVVLAPRYVQTRGQDIFYLTLHGLLHLLGYTHDKKSDTMEMERLEARVLRVLALGQNARPRR